MGPHRSTAGLRVRAVALAVAALLLSACSGSSDDDGDAGNDADATRGSDTATVSGTATGDDAGGCADEVQNAAAGAEHVDPGTTMDYSGVPPVSGKHWAVYPEISKLVYSEDERPDLGQLVHSQEHGWTLIWYDDSIRTDDAAMSNLEDVANAVAAANPAKVVFVPWTSDDGDTFPDNAHIALTHWSVQDDGTEVRQFCANPNADAVLAFVGRHPYTDSREPNAP